MEYASYSGRHVVLRGIIVLSVLVALVLTGPVGISHAAKEIKVGIAVGLTGGASPLGKGSMEQLPADLR